MTKEKKDPKKTKERFKLPEPPKAFRDLIGMQFPAVIPDGCRPAIGLLNEKLVEGCSLRSHFVVESGRPCAKGSGATAPVDLVVVIDTSNSMNDEATDLSAAADAAIQDAEKSCPSDLRVSWFGVEGTWPNTKFTQSIRDYLLGLGVPEADIVGPVLDSLPQQGAQEDGASAIMDLSDHFDWRPGASRAIFYLGDEALSGGNPQNADDVTAATSAIAVAQAKGVTVFTYAGTDIAPDTLSEYARVASETGGQSFVAPASNLGGFQAILEQVICNSAGGGCGPVEVPMIRPCFELKWGDGPNDRIETHDEELMCITASNPYSNVTFKDLTVLLSIVTETDGSAVPSLPDKTDSVYIKPLYITCFGDLPPCSEKNPDEFPQSSREYVLISRGAKEGKYHIHILYCYSIEFHIVDLDRFEIELVKS